MHCCWEPPQSVCSLCYLIEKSFAENLCWRGGKNLLAYLDTIESFHYVNQPGYPEPDGKKTWVTMLKTREETLVSKMHYGENINVEALKWQLILT